MTHIEPEHLPLRRTRTVHKGRGLPPMDPALPHRDAKRERFIQSLFEGRDLYEAFTLAGFKSPRGNAHKMEREDAVQARLAYLRRRLDEIDFVSRSYRRLEVRRMLTAIAMVDRTGMFETVEVERTVGRGENEHTIKESRTQLKPLDKLTPEQRQLFEGLGDGGRAVLPGKLAALQQLCRLDGLDAPAKVAPTDPSGEREYGETDIMALIAQASDSALERWQQLVLDLEHDQAAGSGDAKAAD